MWFAHLGLGLCMGSLQFLPESKNMQIMDYFDWTLNVCVNGYLSYNVFL